MEKHAVRGNIFGFAALAPDFDFTEIGSLMGNRTALCMSG